MRALKTTALFAAAACLVVLSGCEEPGRASIGYYMSHPSDLERIHRVVFVELPAEGGWPGAAQDMTIELSHAIKARRLFRLQVVSRQDSKCHRLSLNCDSGFTMRQLRDLRRALECDAVLVGKMNNLRPHPRTQVELDLRLYDLRQGQLIWAVDHVWDTADRKTVERMRRYFQDQIRRGYEPMNWEIAMISPKSFQRFVAYEVAATLPEPPAPEAQAQRPSTNSAGK